MKPTIITEPSLLVPAHVAAWLGPLAVLVENEAQRDRLTIPADVVEALDKLRLLGDTHRQGLSRVPQGVPRGDTSRADVVKSLSVKETANILMTRAQRSGAPVPGSLAGERVGNTWRVDAASVATRVEHAAQTTQEKP